MVTTEKNFDKLANMYETLIEQFLILHNVKEVVCTDTKEHFFDRIVVAENGSIEVFNHGFTKITWSRLLFDFTSDYAVCLANMEHDLFMQTRNGQHNNYNFIFDEDYIEPILTLSEYIKGLDKYDNL